MAKFQNNFNGGELDPFERERVELDIYNAGLALGENVLPGPHGGLRRRGGLYTFSRLRRVLEPVTILEAQVAAPNGGTPADFIAGDEIVTTNNMAVDTLYVVASIDFGSAQAVSTVTIDDFYIDDGSPEAGTDPSGGSTGGGTLPSNDPGDDWVFPRWDGDFKIP